MAQSNVHTQPPSDLPTDPRAFWSAAIKLNDPEPPSFEDAKPALERLGPHPFPRGGFPLLGFLATVYEHVSTRAGGALHDKQR